MNVWGRTWGWIGNPIKKLIDKTVSAVPMVLESLHFLKTVLDEP